MKIKHTVLLLFVAFTFLNNQCHNDKDFIEPNLQAEISQDKNIIEPGEAVLFSDRSSGADKIRWNFGNGVSSTATDTAIVYNTPGTYTVMLTATNFRTGEVATTSSTIIVGERFITGVKITYLLLEKGPAGFWWDDHDGPDLQLRLKRSDQPDWEFTRVLKNNVVETDLPLTQHFQPIKVTKSNWTINLEDYDSPTQSDVISSWQFNPIQAPVVLPHNGIIKYVRSYDDGKGYYTLTNTPVQVDLLFEIK